MMKIGSRSMIFVALNAIFLLTKTAPFAVMQKHSHTEQRWGRSSVWLERLPVTQKAASSSLVAPAINLGRL